MSWDYKSITIKERLGRLENELDELINLQEATRNNSNVHTEARGIGNKKKNVQNCSCVNVTSNTHNLVHNQSPCCHNKTTPAPLTDISKFLQHINLNISKGTQAITRFVNLTAHQKCGVEKNSKLYHENCFQKNNSYISLPDTTTLAKPNNEDDLFREIRGEKEKRQRAEHQVKCLKDEIKNNKVELQQKTDSILLLQNELKQTLEKLEEVKNQLHQLYQDQQASERLWPFQYQILTKEVEDERVRREEAERNVQVLQDKLKQKVDCIEENFKVHRSVNWLKGQNQHLTYLIEKLQNDIEAKKFEISNKNQTLEGNLKKMRQVINVCEKLRDNLVLMKKKSDDGEEKLRYNLIHCQKLTDELLKEQAKSEEMKRKQLQERQEQQRLLDSFRTATSSSEALQTRVDEISELLKHQKDVIDRQSEKLSLKEEQLKLAYENIKLHDEREKELENKIKVLYSEEMEGYQSVLNKNMNKLKLELENEQEKVLIKEKIIESNLQSTIKLKTVLCEKENEIHDLKRDISEKEQKIAIMQNTNDQLLSKIKSIQCCKQELKQRIEELEEELESQESSEQAKQLDIIEKQISEKLKNLEAHNKLIKQEKEEILETSKRTTKKLENTIAELKKELTTQELNITDLNMQLRDKDQQLKETYEKISFLSQKLEEASEQAMKFEQIYRQKLKSACDAWQKTMQVLQS